MLRLFVSCVLLCLLVLQVLGGGVERRRVKAHKVCSAIPTTRFFGHTVDTVEPALYAVSARDEVVWMRGCPLDLPKMAEPFHPLATAVGMRALLEIQDWVCSVLMAANELGVKTYVDSSFYEALVDAMFIAHRMLTALSRVENTHNIDALHLVDASAAAQDIMPALAQVMLRLPCFCQLLELMSIPRKSDHLAMCDALLAPTDKPVTHTKYANIHKATIAAYWEPIHRFASDLPVVETIRESSCGLESLSSAWAPTCGASWFGCTAVYRVNGYRVYVAPAGLMLYHGSRTLSRMTVPDGMLWLGEHATGSCYVNTVWKTKKHTVDTPALHSFVTTKNILLVHLMDYENNRLMQESLPNHLYLTHVTGYPDKPLHRSSNLPQDKAVFRQLCGKWPLGVYGYADNYPPPSTLHPELMLCDARGLIEPLGTVTPARRD